MTEDGIRDALVSKLAISPDKVKVARPRRIFVTVDADRFEKILDFSVKDLGFTILCTITGLDNGQTLGFIYHLTRQDGITLNIQFDVPRDNPTINTVTRHFPSAEIYERELIDLLGARVEGLGKGIRYPLPDDWPKDQYPLRKDWVPSKKNKGQMNIPEETKDA